MTSEATRITSRHLQRIAYLYVRQSSLRQVFENQESTKRQYALRQRAVALGWPLERIIVIDSDLGRSGASSVDREGFQRLVAEVSLGRAGIVMGLEVSRLARSSTDWHRLLEICALSDTLILDEDGIYDPAHFNDRLLLGLKGTMSEAELHILRARLRGGLLNKARRGELEVELPVGYVRDDARRVRLDPDLRVQEAVREVFRAFRRTGSASATMMEFRRAGRKFPRRVRHGPNQGELVWDQLRHHRAIRILHHPAYAGAFCFGRQRVHRLPNGRTRIHAVAESEWFALIRDAHEGYVSWEEFRENLARLKENARAHAEDRTAGPPREGSALLQGIVLCGVCGDRMTIRYHQRDGKATPDYVCQSRRVQDGDPVCQVIPGHGIDQAVADLVVETMTPVALEVALAVEEEIETRAQEGERVRQQELERLRYEAELSRRRFVRVDPDHRLVADALEAEWNEKLRAFTLATEREQERATAERTVVDEECRKKILALATDLPRVFNDPATPDRERKRMVRLLIEDVTLTRRDEIAIDVRFKGGTTQSLRIPLPLSAWKKRMTSPAVVETIDRMMETQTSTAIAQRLNLDGLQSGEGKPFTPSIVRRIEHDYHLKTRLDRLRARGMLTPEEFARTVDVSPATIRHWRQRSLVHIHVYNGRGEYLIEPPGEDTPTKYMWQHQQKKIAAKTTCSRSDG